MRDGALIGKGTAQLASDQIDSAISTLQTAASPEESNYYTPIALGELANTYEAADKPEDRKRVLTQLSKDYASSRYGQIAIVMLAQLDSKKDASTDSEESATPSEETADAAEEPAANADQSSDAKETETPAAADESKDAPAAPC